ncbi:MAG: putative LPS assembly protein LptD, partial [bacterium]
MSSHSPQHQNPSLNNPSSPSGSAFPSLPRANPTTPVRMIDGDQEIVGVRLEYNLKTRQGRVIEGSTRYQDGRYWGQAIKRKEEKIYHIHSCFYTTCDAPRPHYGFWSRDLKLQVQDRAIARPVVLMFEEVPVLAVPFGIFPARGGRRSGLMVPTYGESAAQGRFLTGIGYYWAPNDYIDLKSQLDFYERYGILIKEDFNYALRYHLTGNISGSYVNQRREGGAVRRWDLGIGHSQQLSPNASLSVSAYFSSDNTYLRDISFNPTERLRRTIRSDATLNQRWSGSPWSLSLNLHHEKDLQTGAWYSVLPQLFLTRNSTPLLKPGLEKPSLKSPWWSRIYLNYRSQGMNTKRFNVVTRVTETLKEHQERWGVRHDLSLTASFSPWEVLNLTPRLNYTEIWADRWFKYHFNADSNRVDTTKYIRLKPRRTFNTGAGLSTRLYGIIHPRLLGIEALRHTLTPSLSFTYTPDFSDPQWGYYDRWERNGRKFYYDRFANNLFGPTPRGRQEALGISLDNLLEYKRRKGEQLIKRDLFSLGFSTSHNFAADSLKWSSLSSNMRIRPLTEELIKGISGLGLDIAASHSFYRQVYDSLQQRYHLVNRPTPGGLRLESVDFSTSLRISGTGKEGTPPDTNKLDIGGLEGDRFQPRTWQPSGTPWQIGMSARFSLRPEPTKTHQEFWVALNGEISATRFWKVNASTTIDLQRKNLTTLQIAIYRDLHCWQGSFIWNPRGAFQGYYLNISVKSPHLRDLKVEKREGDAG